MAEHTITEFERAKREAKRIVDAEERQAIHIPELLGFSLEEILKHEFPKRRVLLARGEDAILRAGNITQIFAYRGTGKTWLLETIALILAYRVEALGLSAPERSRVLYIDGEMPSEDVKERFIKLCGLLDVTRELGVMATRWLTIVGADWQTEYLPRLDTPAGQTAIEPFVEPADVVIIDNRSCLFDPESEKDPSAWQLVQDWLLSLRRRGKCPIMAHHTNRQGGARGIGKAEDVIDINIKLSLPEGYTMGQGARFHMEFDKARPLTGEAAAPFGIVALTSNGWEIEGSESPEVAENKAIVEKILEFLRALEGVGERTPRNTASKVVIGAKVQKTKGLKLITSLTERGVIKRTDDGVFYVVPPAARQGTLL